MKFSLSAIILLIFSYSLVLFSQDNSSNDEREKMIIYELQEYKYLFFKGDTLRYKIASFDSIVINYGKPLEKTRFEYIEITCDSVTKDKRYLLNFNLKSLISDESIGGAEKSRRTSSPWQNRKSYLWLDSLGNRIGSMSDDSLLYAMSPGGAFAPYLFFPFKERYRYINESWLVNSKDTLCENGVPCATLNQSSLFRARHPLDTLGHSCNKFSYIKTGTGAINVLTNETMIRTESTISGSGVITISNKDFIPVHYFANIEQKLQIFYPDTDEIPGVHFISTDWTLDEFIPSKLRSAPPKKKKK
ncbi:MAG: hypothetical protein KIT33_13050 [Candidatus Kapabacteria bacterium]|nr:hypothetical protein [Candidatus Kapabacteria bacterium]